MGLGRRIAVALGFRSDPRRESAEERAYGRYSGGLNVYQIPQSKVIVIKYSSTDPKGRRRCRQCARRNLRGLDPGIRVRTDRASAGMARLADRIAAPEGCRDRSRGGRVSRPRRPAERHPIHPQLPGIAGIELADRVGGSPACRRARQGEFDLRPAGARRKVDASTEALNSPLIQRLREQQAALSRSRAQLAITYLPSHPKLAAVQSEIANIDRQIRNEAMRIVDSLEDQAKIASSREATLRASLNAAKAKASGTNQDEVKLRALEREAAANRQLLETFLNRYTDASTRQDLIAQPGMARIIQRAAIPSSPSYPLTGPTVLLAALAGLDARSRPRLPRRGHECEHRDHGGRSSRRSCLRSNWFPTPPRPEERHRQPGSGAHSRQCRGPIASEAFDRNAAGLAGTVRIIAAAGCHRGEFRDREECPYRSFETQRMPIPGNEFFRSLKSALPEAPIPKPEECRRHRGDACITEAAQIRTPRKSARLARTGAGELPIPAPPSPTPISRSLIRPADLPAR